MQTKCINESRFHRGHKKEVNNHLLSVHLQNKCYSCIFVLCNLVASFLCCQPYCICKANGCIAILFLCTSSSEHQATKHSPSPKSEISSRNILHPKLDRSEFNPTNHLMASSSPLSHSVCSEGGCKTLFSVKPL